MDANRKLWNEQQKILRGALSSSGEHQKAIELFLSQHAMVHSSMVTKSETASFADEVWQDMDEESIRRIPRNCEHSVAWVVWHISRIEDVTMNMLVAGSPQVLYRDDWHNQMGVEVHHTGNAMDEKEVAELGATIDIEALRAYRVAVGRRTREIVKQLEPEDLKQKVEPSRLQQVMAEGAVVEAAREIVDYWGKRTISGLLLMPPTRHNFIHLNEALRIKQKLR